MLEDTGEISGKLIRFNREPDTVEQTIEKNRYKSREEIQKEIDLVRRDFQRVVTKESLCSESMAIGWRYYFEYETLGNLLYGLPFNTPLYEDPRLEGMEDRLNSRSCDAKLLADGIFRFEGATTGHFQTGILLSGLSKEELPRAKMFCFNMMKSLESGGLVDEYLEKTKEENEATLLNESQEFRRIVTETDPDSVNLTIAWNHYLNFVSLQGLVYGSCRELENQTSIKQRLSGYNYDRKKFALAKRVFESHTLGVMGDGILLHGVGIPDQAKAIAFCRKMISNFPEGVEVPVDSLEQTKTEEAVA